MIDKIFNALFEKKKKVNCITVVKDRAMKDGGYKLLQKENKQVVKTCLSDYFKYRKGLNMSEREKFYTIVFNARSPQ